MTTPPTIAGTTANQAANDSGVVPIDPFSSVTITDPSGSDSVAITLVNGLGAASDANGTLSGSGLIKTGTGTYSLAAGTPAAVTSALDALVFAPTQHEVTPGQTVTTGFDLAVTGAGGTATDANTSVAVQATSSSPAIIGTVLSANTSDEAAVMPFSTAAIQDSNVGGLDSVTISLSGTIAGVLQATDADGVLSGSGLTKVSAGTYILATGSAANVTAALRALSFTPTAHQVAPGASVATRLSVSVTDQYGTGSAPQTTVLATAVNDAPVVTGATAGQSLTDEGTIKPFATLSVTDPDVGAQDSATITLAGTGGVATDADGGLSGAGLTKSSAGVYKLAATTPGTLTSELAALVFTPTAHQVAPGSSVTTGFTLAIAQGATLTTNSTASVVATAVNDAPSVTGAVAAQTGSDVVPFSPLPALTVTDPDVGAQESAVLTLTNAAGTLTDANGALFGMNLTKSGVGTYNLAAATPAALSSELQGLLFTPTAHQVAPGGTITTGLALAVTQGTTTSTTNTSFTITAANDTPVLSLPNTGLTTTDETPIAPFAGAVLSDVDTGIQDTVSITLIGSAGAPTDADGVLSGTGLSRTGTGTFVLAAAAPIALASELNALIFTPTVHQTVPGQSVTTRFAVVASQGTATVAGAATVTATAVVNPFSGLSVIDPTEGQTVVAQTDTVLVNLSSNLPGTYSALGTGSYNATTGLYTATGTAVAVSADLAGVQFSPATPANLPNGLQATLLGGAAGALLTDNGTFADVGTGADTLVGSGSASTLVGGAGSETFVNASQGDVAFGGTGATTVIQGASAGTVVAGSAHATVFAGAGGGLFFAGAGPLSFVGGSGVATVIGGPVSSTMFGGSGGGAMFGGSGGGDELVAGSGQVSLIGSGGSQLWTASAANDILVAGAGNETLGAAGSSGNNVFFTGSGNDVLTDGSGSDVVLSGGGAATVFAGQTGTSTVFVGSGQDLLLGGGGAESVVGGSGNDTVFTGTGADRFVFNNGGAGGSEVISGFKVGVDQIQLFGYGIGAGAAALASAQTKNGILTMVLADNTRIAILGVGSLTSTSVVSG